MAIITAITEQKDKNRVNLFLDGEFTCGLTRFALVSAGFKLGQEVDEDRLSEVIRRSEYDSCMQKGMKYLSLKPVTAKTMRDYLMGKGFDEDLAGEVVDRLLELGLLNDAAYADMYVKYFRNKAGNGLIKYKLKRLGVEDGVIENALSDESEACIVAAKKYLKTHKPDRQKLYNFLFNKGFGSDSVRSTVGMMDELAADNIDSESDIDE